MLLADFAVINSDAKVVDLGCGNGILPLLLAARDKGKEYFGFEIQAVAAELAGRNAALNNLAESIRIFEEDLKKAPQILGRGAAEAVISNPPYYKLGSGVLNPESARAIARHEILCTLPEVLQTAAALLKPNGSFFLVHRGSRMTELMREGEACGLFPKRIRMVHSNAMSDAKLLLCEMKREKQTELRIMPPCILYEAEGKFTKEVHAIYYGKAEEAE